MVAATMACLQLNGQSGGLELDLDGPHARWAVEMSGKARGRNRGGRELQGVLLGRLRQTTELCIAGGRTD
jgi:hypothetical protein